MSSSLTAARAQPMLGFFIVLLVGSGYVFLDTGLNITDFFYSDPFPPLKSIWVFVLTIIWPAAAAAIYFIVQMGVVVVVLREKKPLRTPCQPLLSSDNADKGAT